MSNPNSKSMIEQQLLIMEELLVLNYGKSFISDFEMLRDMLETEFDFVITTEELKKISKFDFSYEEEDIELIIRHCGINY